MRSVHPIVLGIAVLFSGAAGLWAAVEPVPTANSTETAAPATMPLDPFAQDLLNRLNSADPAQRQAALKQLASIAGLMQSTEIVTRMQEIATDQDLKDFLGERVVQIRANEEERYLTHLPGISLNVRDASLAEVVTKLNTALDAPTKFETGNTGGRAVRDGLGGGVVESGPTWTLDMKDKPLWAIFLALQDQQPLELQSYDNQIIRVSAGGIRGERRYLISGPVITYATGINYQRNVSFPIPPGRTQAASLYVQLMTVVDPRIRVTRAQRPTAVHAIDDEGRDLAPPNQGGGYQNSPRNIFTWSVSLTAPERLAKTVTVSYDSAITTTVGDTTVEFADIQKNINKPVTFAGRTVRIANVSGSTTLSVQLEVQPLSDSGFDANTSIPFTIIDATGRTVYSSNISRGNTRMSFSTANTEGPYKLEFRVPGRNVDLPVHVELKNLPLP